MTIPELHDFKSMLEHLETGGAAWRYGSHYPIYTKHENYMGGISRILVQGTGNGCEWIDMRGVEFSVNEQQSINWVFMSAEDWSARQKNYRENYIRSQAEQDLVAASSKIQKSLATPRSIWSRLFGRSQYG